MTLDESPSEGFLAESESLIPSIMMPVPAQWPVAALDRQPEGPLATCSGRHWHSASASCQCQWSGASLPVTALCLPVRCQPASDGRSGPLADVRSLPLVAPHSPEPSANPISPEQAGRGETLS